MQRKTNAVEASGIGLTTAAMLAQRPDWEIHLLDLNSEQCKKATSGLGSNAFPHALDVTDYAALGQVFKKIFQRHKRLDFVYANAGIGESNNLFYEPADTGIEPPPLPMQMNAIVGVCLNAAITTCYLAEHYLRQSPEEARADRLIVITASCGALYPAYGTPVYTATKHGILGFMRSIAPIYYRNDGIRVNAVLPGTVKTNLLTSKQWEQFPSEYFTPVEEIAKAVLILLDGKDPVKGDSLGFMNGKAVEVNGRNRYWRDQYEYCDAAMKAVMSATDA
jgi:NAD(P)-dependent dehydrogenase (short-subunit alcohol dehydrogenase family)